MKKFKVIYKNSIGDTYIETVFKFQLNKVLKEVESKGYKLVSVEQI